jgi:microcystin-dependent protein
MPNTVNRFFSVPNTGDLPGAWGTSALNPNFNSIDGTLGGVGTIALSVATTITLTLPAGASFTPGAGPSQSENALLKFTGTLTGNAVIKFTMPGFYIVQNACGSAAAFSIQLTPASGGGNSIGAPPGRKAHIFFDGTDVDYVDTPEVGSALDIHQSGTSLPVWMSVCTVKPYLIKDGTVYNTSAYTALAQLLGSTFGGNGVTTFGVPDELNRIRIPVDTGSNNRITNAGSGITGTQMNSAGGDQLMQSHNHTATVVDGGHIHTVPGGGGSFGVQLGPGGNAAAAGIAQNTSTSTTGILVTVNATGSGVSGNMPPSIVNFLPLIKT